MGELAERKCLIRKGARVPMGIFFRDFQGLRRGMTNDRERE
jgi:hypothetical protein